ncbi:Uncharacterized protein TCM_038362 [Theobroma cacao]|uniref:Uncharacterized protein n=1 Tax=Theobroma cacao TaxID=3641 RepID=A0A061GPG3_THECC|nr:Uncharacterized protein TCM_038362 [Theobroma cacao]
MCALDILEHGIDLNVTPFKEKAKKEKVLYNQIYTKKDDTRRKPYKENDSSPPFSVPLDIVQVFFHEWIRDGQVYLPYVT